MSLPSPPLGFFLSRKPLGFLDKSLTWTVRQKPLGQFALEPTLERSSQQPKAIAPCLGQQIQAKLLTHPLIAASGIEPSKILQTQILQRSRRQFPLPLKFISFDTDTALLTDSPGADTLSTTEPSEPLGDTGSLPANIVQNKIEQQSRDPQSPIQNLANEVPDQGPRGAEPLQAKLDLAPSESPSILFPSSQESVEETEQVSPQSPLNDLPPVDQETSDTASTGGRSVDAVSNIQPYLPESSQLSEYPTQAQPTVEATQPSLDDAELSALQELAASQAFPLPEVQPSSSTLPSFLNHQAESFPRFPSILPPTTNLLQRQLFPQALETASSSPTIAKGLPNLLQPSERPILLPQQPSTPMVPLFPEEGDLIDTPAGVNLELPLDSLATDDSDQTISLLPTLQRSPIQQASDISVADSQLDIASTRFDAMPWPLETSNVQQIYRSAWEPLSSSDSERSDEVLSINSPLTPPPKISSEVPFSIESINQIQRQSQTFLNVDEALTAPSTDISPQQQSRIPLEPTDVLALEPFTEIIPIEKSLPNPSQFSSTDGQSFQPNQAQSTELLQRQPLFPPDAQADLSLSPENKINKPTLEPTLQIQQPLALQSKLLAEISSQSEELKESSSLPNKEPSFLNYIQSLDSVQPSTEFKGTLRAKYMPLMAPLRQPLGAWDTAQDIMKRSISRQSIQERATTASPPKETVRTGQPQAIASPVVAPPDASTPGNWSTLEELLTNSTSGKQREAWEEQNSL